MNPIPTDDLRVVRAPQPEIAMSGIPECWVPPRRPIVAIQRRWLVPDGERYHTDDWKPRNPEDANVNPPAHFDDCHIPIWQPMRSEWRDLPEVEL